MLVPPLPEGVDDGVVNPLNTNAYEHKGVDNVINLKKNPVVETIEKDEVVAFKRASRTTGGGIKPTIQGFPLYNEFDHTLIDLQHIAPGTADWGHTLSVKLPNGQQVTLCVMQTSTNESCIDIKYFENGQEIEDSIRAMGFSSGSCKSFDGAKTIAVIREVK